MLGALAGGGVAMARHEAAQLIRGCLAWLRSKGHAASELAAAAEAFTRGADAEIAADLDRLGADTRSRAGAQLDHVLAEPGRVDDLTDQAQKVQDQLTRAGLLTRTRTGALIYQPAGPTVIGDHGKAVGTIKVKTGNVSF